MYGVRYQGGGDGVQALIVDRAGWILGVGTGPTRRAALADALETRPRVRHRRRYERRRPPRGVYV